MNDLEAELKELQKHIEDSVHSNIDLLSGSEKSAQQFNSTLNSYDSYMTSTSTLSSVSNAFGS